MRVTLRLDFDADRRLGPGKVALLEAIRATGSISAAGRQFGMAYRKAWLLTDELNRMFQQPLIETRGGGRNGGGATLTQMGERVIALYRQAEDKFRASAGEQLDALALCVDGPTAERPTGIAAVERVPEPGEPRGRLPDKPGPNKI